MGDEVRIWPALAALNGFMAVAAGAFGAHAAADPMAREWLRTGAQYQAVHAVAALACFALVRPGVRSLNCPGWLFGLGALVFGGSLYLMALTGVRLLGAVTPFGGGMLLVGWAMLFWRLAKAPASPPAA